MRALILFGIVLLLAGESLEAQIRNPRRFGRQPIPQATAPAKPPEPKTAEEMVTERMPDIIEAVELNDFEAAVVSSILIKYVQQRIELQILKLEPDQTRAALEKIQKEEEAELRQGLSPEKYEAMMTLRENRYNTKKVNKKRKKKKQKKKT